MAKVKLSFDTADWLKDEELSRCSTATRGVWMDLICKMHDADRSGELAGTADELAIPGRFTAAEFIDAARELRDQQVAQIRFDGSTFSVRNRRMFRAAEKRKANAERQLRYRERTNNDPVTRAFERFWAAFPKGRKHAKGDAREAFRKAVTKADAETIIQAATEYAASDKGQGKFVQGPEPWLNQERWNDDRAAWRDLDKPAEGGFRKVTREEFKQAVDDRAFKDGPRRASSDPCWVFGTLRDGTKIECRNYWPPKQSNDT